MKNSIKKIIAILTCVCLVLSFAACSSDENNAKQDPNSNNVNLGGLNVEFKYSKDCMSFDSVLADSELFRADGIYGAGDVEVVYLHFKNHTSATVTHKVNFRAIEGEFKDSIVGVVEDVRSAFADTEAAKSAVQGQENKLSDGYIYACSMEADSTKTVAVVLQTPTATSVKIRVDYSVINHGKPSANAIVVKDGINTVNADCFAVVNNAKAALLLENGDSSFKISAAANAFKQGDVVMAKVSPANVQKGSVDYHVSALCDGKSCENEFKISILAGYGLEGVEVLKDGAKIDSAYDMYSGMVTFTSKLDGKFTVKYSGSVDIKGVILQGGDQLYTNFNDAVNAAASASVTSEKITLLVFGKAEYTVQSGQKMQFVTNGGVAKNINIVGGNDTAEIFITRDSGSVPSLPYANKGALITYSGITFDGENELQEGGEYSRHFDYRGEANISFKNCTFKKALATRGPSSNVLVEGCNFICPTYEDTFKGYCYYSVQKIGGGDITVELYNNDFTGCWGGINLDWAEAEFIVSENKFGGYNCSKPAIQLSHADTMLIDDNEFSNITDENAFRFYKGYNGQKTAITNNTFQKVDYLFQSDTPNAMLQFKDFVFTNNTISKDTNLTMGHYANASADDIGPHGYTVDTTLNTIK